MSPAAASMRNLAGRLIAHEAKETKSSGAKSTATFPVCEKLRPRLTALVGTTGFNALLSRALALARPEVPWLRAVHVNADGSLKGLSDLDTQVDPAQIIRGRLALLANLLSLLVAFIGEKLTLQLMREVWPKLVLKNVVFASGDEHEIQN